MSSAEILPNGNASHPQGAMVRREQFDGLETVQNVETSASMVAAKATAMVQARVLVAMKRPRDMDNVRVNLLKECKRPTFAAVARYRKPIGQGGGVEGWSIRFVEAAIRIMGNLDQSVVTMYDDPEKRIVSVTVLDLESNIAYSTEITLDKTVERRKLKTGEQPLRVRINSRGEHVYLMPATEDELFNKQNALISKALRSNGLRLVPGDILDECKGIVFATLDAEVKNDPDAAKKKLADGFAELGILPSNLKEYLGHDLGTASPAEIKALRELYAGVRDGEFTWHDMMNERGSPKEEGAQPKGNSEKLKAQVAAKKAAVVPPTDSTVEPPDDTRPGFE